MKELILSTVEREFILKAIGERKRLDGRQAYDVRCMNVQFGVDSGCCIVDVGDTKVEWGIHVRNKPVAKIQVTEKWYNAGLREGLTKSRPHDRTVRTVRSVVRSCGRSTLITTAER